tara:strand:- start:1827 stop:2693 length:867 start_codon:yes stop_codon:yes gene_type:complete
MRILITGGFGQLGTSVYQRLIGRFDIIRTGRIKPVGVEGIEMDLRDGVKVKQIIQLFKPDLILHLGAMTNVDQCELNPYIAREVNIAGTEHLCEAFSGKIIYISTDYVFDGHAGPYSEDANVCPINVYGETKLASERLVLLHNNNNLILRGNVLYDYAIESHASFLNWVIQSLKDSIEIQVVNDQFNNPTWTYSLADIISLCIDKDISGLYHWADADIVTRYDFALNIAKVFSLDRKLIKSISTKDLNQSAMRPLKSGLVADRIAKALHINQPTMHECLEQIKQKMIE